MSDMTPEPEPKVGDRLNDALLQFTGCVGMAIEDICSYGLTIGDSYVPFDPDPEDDCDETDAMCSQVWVRVMNVAPQATDSWEGDCATVMQLQIEVGVIRCIEVPEDGEAPTATDVMNAAMQAMSDMNALYCAAMGCEVWNAINVGTWEPMGPMGGQYGGTWDFTVEL